MAMINIYDDETRRKKEECPVCGICKRGSAIPRKDRHWYGGATHGSRWIGIEVRGLYDGVVIWRCEECGTNFNRWTGHIHVGDFDERLRVQ